MGKILRNGIEFSSTSDTANNINYDNSKSGLDAVTVQEAIDELSTNFTESLNSLKTKKITATTTASGNANLQLSNEDILITVFTNTTDSGSVILLVPYKSASNAWWCNARKSNTNELMTNKTIDITVYYI